jgi:hypothetical protein
MATKAIHLELVSDLTTEAFLDAFTRSILRSGKNSNVCSDNGTAFLGVNNELNNIYELLRSPVRQQGQRDCAIMDGTKWNFNPPHAPRFKGIWEAGKNLSSIISKEALVPLALFAKQLPLSSHG